MRVKSIAGFSYMNYIVNIGSELYSHADNVVVYLVSISKDPTLSKHGDRYLATDSYRYFIRWLLHR